MTYDEIKNASREQLVAYLESWGYQCYDSESVNELRKAAFENFQVEHA